MELLNSMNKYNSFKKDGNFNAELLFEATRNILKLISPITPFITEELWEKLGMSCSIHKTEWPGYDPELAREEKITIVFQVNGKIREKREFQAGSSEEEVSKVALTSPRIIENIKDKTIIKKIFVKDKLYNIVTG
jgi:leucyl-tRNA synthetase